MTDTYSESPTTCNVVDCNLPAVVASLEMLTVNTNLKSLPENRRILRKRVSRPVPSENLNRRCSLRPQKRKYNQMDTEDDIKEYYLDKNIKKVQNTLETIYEEKDGINESTRFMSVKKYRRMIHFQNVATDSKIEKRRAKIKKVFGSKSYIKKTLSKCTSKQSMQKLLDKLNGISSESPSKTDNENK